MPSIAVKGLELAAHAKTRWLTNPRVRHAVDQATSRRYFAGLEPHDRMLADDMRVDAYYRALTRNIKQGDVVVDIGTGTGILAYYASRAGARKVYALDYSGLIESAEELVRANGVTNVEFVPTHSRGFDPGEKVDAIVHEQMGVELFDERMMVNLLDVRDRLLKPGGRILPNRFDFFTDAVQLDDEYRMPFVWERTLHGFDLSLLERRKATEGRGYFMQRHWPAHFSHFLTAPQPTLQVDLETATSPALPHSLAWKRPVTHDGRLDGFAVYFVAHFDPETSLSTSPAARSTHWGFRLLRTEGQELETGQTLQFELAGHVEDPATWTWSHSVSQS